MTPLSEATSPPLGFNSYEIRNGRTQTWMALLRTSVDVRMRVRFDCLYFSLLIVYKY